MQAAELFEPPAHIAESTPATRENFNCILFAAEQLTVCRAVNSFQLRSPPPRHARFNSFTSSNSAETLRNYRIHGQIVPASAYVDVYNGKWKHRGNFHRAPFKIARL